MMKPKRDQTSGASPVSPTLEFTAESLYNFMKEKFNELDEKWQQKHASKIYCTELKNKNRPLLK